MQITYEQVKWLGYKDWRGPFWAGSRHAKLDLPENPTSTDLIVDVISHTEGRYFNSYNGYDSCRSTVGPIQVCERAQYAVSTILGKLAEEAPSTLDPLYNFCGSAGLEFKKDHRGRWRFYLSPTFVARLDNDTVTPGFVDREVEQTSLFWLNSPGKKGSWDEESEKYAKGMAAAIINSLGDSEGFAIHRKWVANRVRLYAFKHAKTLINEAPDTDVGNALVAGLLSYCVNNPSWAAKHCRIADEAWKGERWTIPWLISIFKQCTFGPRVAIYPHRWEAIRGPLERHYGLDLPDFEEDLKAWGTVGGPTKKLSTKEIQHILRHILAFDLGSSGPNGDGVDGVYGGKTKAAVKDVQKLCGLEEDGWVGKDTQVVLLGAQDAWSNLSADQQANYTATVRLDVLKEAAKEVV